MRVPVPERILLAEELGRVHFIGIGGAGLSAIARLMLARGIAVSGSDGVASPVPSVCVGSLSPDLITFEAAVVTADASWGIAVG